MLRSRIVQFLCNALALFFLQVDEAFGELLCLLLQRLEVCDVYARANEAQECAVAGVPRNSGIINTAIVSIAGADIAFESFSALQSGWCRPPGND